MEEFLQEQRPLGARDFFETYLFTYIAGNISVDYPGIVTKIPAIRQKFVEISKEKLLSKHSKIENLSDLETLMMLAVFWNLIVDYFPEVENDPKWRNLLEPDNLDSILLESYVMSSQTLSNTLKRGGLNTARGRLLLKLAAEDAYKFFKDRLSNESAIEIHYQYYIFGSFLEAIELFYKENTCHLITSSDTIIQTPFRFG